MPQEQQCFSDDELRRYLEIRAQKKARLRGEMLDEPALDALSVQSRDADPSIGQEDEARRTVPSREPAGRT